MEILLFTASTGPTFGEEELDLIPECYIHLYFGVPKCKNIYTCI